MSENTQADISAKGAHLSEIHQVLCANAICLLALASEVKAHVGEAEAAAIVAFTQDVLKPVVGSLDSQLASLHEQYLVADGEVSDLEALLNLPDAPNTALPGNDQGAGPGLYL